MKVDESLWKRVQSHMGYSDDEMKLFRSDPMNEEIILKGLTAMEKEIVCEVVEAKGCMCGHKKGDTIHFDTGGGLKTGKSPETICMHIIEQGTNYIYTACELVHHGIEPERMRFRRFGCLDVGLQCGGWGKVVCKVKMA